MVIRTLVASAARKKGKAGITIRRRKPRLRTLIAIDTHKPRGLRTFVAHHPGKSQETTRTIWGRKMVVGAYLTVWPREI